MFCVELIRESVKSRSALLILLVDKVKSAFHVVVVPAEYSLQNLVAVISKM